MHTPKKTAFILVCFLILAYCVLELVHVFRFGHFAPMGLHADVTVTKADYGIPGNSKAYEAKLTNFGIAPETVTVCDFIDDSMSHGTEVGNSIEKWDPNSKKWEDIFKDLDKSSWCRPSPLAIVKAQVTTKKLWPLQSVSGGEVAVAGYDIFAIGDKARFVIFPGNRTAIPSTPIVIDEHQTVAGVHVSSSPLRAFT